MPLPPRYWHASLYMFSVKFAFETVSHYAALTGLETKLATNSWKFACLRLQSTRIKDMGHHVWLDFFFLNYIFEMIADYVALRNSKAITHSLVQLPLGSHFQI